MESLNVKRFVGLHMNGGKPWIESVSTKDEETAREHMERDDDNLYVMSIDWAEDLASRLASSCRLLQDLDLEHHFVERPGRKKL